MLLGRSGPRAAGGDAGGGDAVDGVLVDAAVVVGEVVGGGCRQVQPASEEAGQLGARDRVGGTEVGVSAAGGDAGRRDAVDVVLVGGAVVVSEVIG